MLDLYGNNVLEQETEKLELYYCLGILMLFSKKDLVLVKEILKILIEFGQIM